MCWFLSYLGSLIYSLQWFLSARVHVPVVHISTGWFPSKRNWSQSWGVDKFWLEMYEHMNFSVQFWATGNFVCRNLQGGWFSRIGEWSWRSTWGRPGRKRCPSSQSLLGSSLTTLQWRPPCSSSPGTSRGWAKPNTFGTAGQITPSSMTF